MTCGACNSTAFTRFLVCLLPLLQALTEERASAIEKLQAQLDLADEKVAVLTAELTHLEQEGRQVRRQLATEPVVLATDCRAGPGSCTSQPQCRESVQRSGDSLRRRCAFPD